MALSRDEWIAYMTRLQADMRAYAQEFDPCERTEHAPLVDELVHDLTTKWAKRHGW